MLALAGYALVFFLMFWILCGIVGLYILDIRSKEFGFWRQFGIGLIVYYIAFGCLTLISGIFFHKFVPALEFLKGPEEVEENFLKLKRILELRQSGKKDKNGGDSS